MRANRADANSKPGALTPQQSEALLHKIDAMLGKSDPASLLSHNAQTGWILGPLVPGAWRMLAGAELENASQRLADANKRFPRANKSSASVCFLVYFYDDAALYEAEVVQKNGERGIVTYMQRGAKPPVFLNGWSDRIRIR